MAKMIAKGLIHVAINRDILKHDRFTILGLQSISGDVADNVSHPCRLDPTMQLITYSFVLYLQHGRHDVKCKPSIGIKSKLGREVIKPFSFHLYNRGRHSQLGLFKMTQTQSSCGKSYKSVNSK